METLLVEDGGLYAERVEKATRIPGTVRAVFDIPYDDTKVVEPEQFDNETCGRQTCKASRC